MPQHDQLHRYLFENFAVRGELVTVPETLQQILENHDYPQPVKNVLQNCWLRPARQPLRSVFMVISPYSCKATVR